MKRTFLWKNFKLGEELSVSGAFIYNGLRRFHELKQLDFADEVFEVFYYLSVGIERLMKIAIVLIEHDDALDQSAFEESLKTHNHQELLARIRKREKIKLGDVHIAFLNLLANFYKVARYDRFTLQSVGMHDREKQELIKFLTEHLKVTIKDDIPIFGVSNEDRYKKFLRNVVLKIAGTLYELIDERAHALNLFTYELRHGSKAEAVFLGKADIPAENILWKELLIFFMNTKETNGYLKFLRGIEPLALDPADVPDFIDFFQADGQAKSLVMDQVETIYEDLPNKSERLEMMNAIGANLYFEEDEDENDDDFEEDEFDANPKA
jgi:hypothetical protein